VDDMFERIKSAANVVLAKVNMDEVLHARLNH
jgi:hypothetical protein